MLHRNQESYQTLGWIINKSEYGIFLVVADEETQEEIAAVYQGGQVALRLSVSIHYHQIKFLI